MLAYSVSEKPVWMGLSLGLVGIVLNVSRFPCMSVTFVGIYCIMFMNGFLYNQTLRKIHHEIRDSKKL